MQKRVKVAAVGTAVAVLIGAGTAYALAGPQSAQSPAPAPVPTELATEVMGEQIDQIAPETVSPTTEPPAPAGLPAEQVKAAQEKLLAMGYWMPNADGKLGSVTQQAVMAFQKVNGMGRTGKLDAAVADAIAKASRPAPANGSVDHIEIDKKRQVIFVVRGGQVAYVFNTSTGTERNYVTDGHRGFAHTPTGTFAVNRVINGVDKGPLGNLYRPRYFTNNGIAVHGSASIPGYPASHGCARVHNAVMDFIWANNLMPMGSKVYVYDSAGSPAMTGGVTPTPTTTAPPAPPTTPAPPVTAPPATPAPTTVPPTTVAPTEEPVVTTP